MPTFLENILQAKQEELTSLKFKTPLAALRSKSRDISPPRGFEAAIRPAQRGSTVRLIGEIKKASPSKGLLREVFHPQELAKIYEDGGASALSVLTERFFFLGDPDHLREARSAGTLPVLRKDFLLTDYHLYEARAMEADAVLLIARILEQSVLNDLIALATDLGMDALVEVHNGEELEKAIRAGARIIGINNRDLETFHVTLQTTKTLLPDIPEEKIRVSESGIHSRRDVETLQGEGVDAILVGEALVTSGNIPAKLRELLG